MIFFCLWLCLNPCGEVFVYQLLDCGSGRKLEKFGDHRVIRQAGQAIWEPRLGTRDWDDVVAEHIRSKSGGGHWKFFAACPEQWPVTVGPLNFHIKLTPFGHSGVFPEQEASWRWLMNNVKENWSILNLFAYTGGSTLACAKAGAKVTHVDASKGVVQWGKDNAGLNDLAEHPIRWMVDDVLKFVAREKRRGNRYDAVILDPPTYGRGKKGEVWNIETDLGNLLASLAEILDLKLILLSCHTPGITGLSLKNMLLKFFPECAKGIQQGEMIVPIKGSELVLPSGTFARWAI